MRLSNINFENPDEIRVALVFTYNINVRKIKGKYHIDTFKPRRNRTDFLYTMIDKMVFRESAKMIYKLQRNIRAATFLLIMTKTGWVYSIAFCSVLDKYDRKQGIREALKKLKIYDNLPWKDKGDDYIIDNYLEPKVRVEEKDNVTMDDVKSLIESFSKSTELMNEFNMEFINILYSYVPKEKREELSIKADNCFTKWEKILDIGNEEGEEKNWLGFVNTFVKNSEKTNDK